MRGRAVPCLRRSANRRLPTFRSDPKHGKAAFSPSAVSLDYIARAGLKRSWEYESYQQTPDVLRRGL
jgi:hypothetical protein